MDTVAEAVAGITVVVAAVASEAAVAEAVVIVAAASVAVASAAIVLVGMVDMVGIGPPSAPRPSMAVTGPR